MNNLKLTGKKEVLESLIDNEILEILNKLFPLQYSKYTGLLSDNVEILDIKVAFPFIYIKLKANNYEKILEFNLYSDFINKYLIIENPCDNFYDLYKIDNRMLLKMELN